MSADGVECLPMSVMSARAMHAQPCRWWCRFATVPKPSSRELQWRYGNRQPPAHAEIGSWPPPRWRTASRQSLVMTRHPSSA